jgi:Kinesin motor domain
LIQGLSEHAAPGEAAALALLLRAAAARAATGGSSRSHFVFTLYLEQRKSAMQSEHPRAALLQFVDLAGAAHAKGQACAGVALQEARHINRDLSLLQQARPGNDLRGTTPRALHVCMTCKAPMHESQKFASGVE